MKLLILVAWAIFFVLLVGTQDGRDDTDPAGGHSGLRLLTDARTGCQYLSAGLFGGIAPRVDGAGRHVGCKP